ncbi:MAG: hypothetical protein ABJN43_17525, partial [Sneathiella sp.]
MSEEQIEPPANSRFDTLISEGSDKLDWASPKAPMSFRFTWEEMVFSAKLVELGTSHRLRMLGDLGSLPFSAEKPKYRERLLNLLAWETEDKRIRFVLEPVRHRIYLMIDDHIDTELTGLTLITSAVESLLHARAYIELAREVGWQHPQDKTPRNFNVIPEKPEPINEDAPMDEAEPQNAEPVEQNAGHAAEAENSSPTDEP